MYIYVNMAKMKGKNGPVWEPCWYAKYLSSGRLSEAVSLRNEWRESMPKFWKKSHFKTVKIKV